MFHDGSLRAEKILYDDKSDAFEQTRISDFVTNLASLQHLKAKDFKRALLDFEMKPLAEISIEKRDTR